MQTFINIKWSKQKKQAISCLLFLFTPSFKFRNKGDKRKFVLLNIKL